MGLTRQKWFPSLAIQCLSRMAMSARVSFLMLELASGTLTTTPVASHNHVRMSVEGAVGTSRCRVKESPLSLSASLYTDDWVHCASQSARASTAYAVFDKVCLIVAR